MEDFEVMPNKAKKLEIRETAKIAEHNQTTNKAVNAPPAKAGGFVNS